MKPSCRNDGSDYLGIGRKSLIAEPFFHGWEPYLGNRANEAVIQIAFHEFWSLQSQTCRQVLYSEGKALSSLSNGENEGPIRHIVSYSCMSDGITKHQHVR